MIAPALRLDLPHGHLVAVAIPDEVTPALLAALHAEERALAAGMAPLRLRTFAAGRAALRIALEDLGLPAGPVLIGDRGAPLLPAGVAASLSHKRALAVALAAPAADWNLGVDLEEDRPGRVDISRRVLTPDERAEVAALPEPERGREVLIRFALKEAFYKAASALTPRRLSFQDVAVQGHARFTGQLLETEACQAEGAVDLRVPGHLLCTARVRRCRATAR